MKKTATTAAPTTTVACPQCGATVVWTSASHWKPFCSERCKLLDLGAWANESYRVAGVETADVSEIEDALAAFSSGASRPH
ncbi:MAG: DNA gyrase inhibitor YacG [Proteobacteria bacterium]|nr:DNA gyrase inhibitor YacG [Pseudomonadota bacterium]MCL2307447.1 DNA gyrase inhibitor YacG [Pseudomonadota bacterium]